MSLIHTFSFNIFSLISMAKENQIIHRLFLVNCSLLHVLLNYAKPASNVGGLVIHSTAGELAGQYIAMTKNNLCIISISLSIARGRICVDAADQVIQFDPS